MIRIMTWMFLAACMGQTIARANETVIPNPGHILPGRYAGYMYLKEAALKVPVVLDTIYVPATVHGPAKLDVYLKLSFGSFHSHEYITHQYTIDDYDWTSSVTILDSVATGSVRDLTMNLDSKEDGKRLSGTARSVRGGVDNAQIELVYRESDDRNAFWFNKELLGTLFPDVPVYPALTGTYRSTCKQTEYLQFELTKQSMQSSSGIDPMEGFAIRGRMSGNFELGSKIASGVKANFSNREDFQYNYYLGRMNVPHSNLGGVCMRTATSIDCGTCSFKAVAEDQPFLEQFVRQGGIDVPNPLQELPTTGELVTAKTKTQSLSKANYQGHIQFEQRNVFRKFTIDINITGRPTPGDDTIAQRIVTFSPRIHLQSSQEQATWQQAAPIEVAPLRMSEDTEARDTIFPDESIYRTASYRILLGKTGDTIQIERWTNDMISGIYYASGFGRVGRFAVYRDAALAPQLPVDVSVPGTFLSAPLRYQDTATHEAWIQMQLNLEWLMNGSGVGPTFLIGGAGNVLVDYMDSLTGRNAAGTFNLTAPRFDPYTGVMGADFSTSEQPQSIMARFSGGRVTLVRNLNSILSDTSTFHSLEVFDRKTTYEFPEPPKASDLVAGSVYTYLPSDATLYVNGVILPNTRNTTLRALRWPTKKPTSGIYRYVFKAVFRTGTTIEHRITMPVAEAEKKPILINFYELQKK